MNCGRALGERHASLGITAAPTLRWLGDKLMDLRVERLTVAEVPHNVALARSVGWPDTAGDWLVVDAAAIVVGAWSQGTLLAQGALGCYGPAGTIAKMIVSPQHRGLGMGSGARSPHWGWSPRRLGVRCTSATGSSRLGT